MVAPAALAGLNIGTSLLGGIVSGFGARNRRQRLQELIRQNAERQTQQFLGDANRQIRQTAGLIRQSRPGVNAAAANRQAAQAASQLTGEAQAQGRQLRTQLQAQAIPQLQQEQNIQDRRRGTLFGGIGQSLATLGAQASAFAGQQQSNQQALVERDKDRNLALQLAKIKARPASKPKPTGPFGFATQEVADQIGAALFDQNLELTGIVPEPLSDQEFIEQVGAPATGAQPAANPRIAKLIKQLLGQ